MQWLACQEKVSKVRSLWPEIPLKQTGLNVEQRRRLTIGVELAAKPQLLFLDEPTSGLDSQTSWAICDLIEKLANSGLAVLCTIHQPSAVLFERFDRLLLLHKGGRMIYFGDIGPNSSAVVKVSWGAVDANGPGPVRYRVIAVPAADGGAEQVGRYLADLGVYAF